MPLDWDTKLLNRVLKGACPKNLITINYLYKVGGKCPKAFPRITFSTERTILTIKLNPQKCTIRYFDVLQKLY